jgi:hypothetical protein
MQRRAGVCWLGRCHPIASPRALTHELNPSSAAAFCKSFAEVRHGKYISLLCPSVSATRQTTYRPVTINNIERTIRAADLLFFGTRHI